MMSVRLLNENQAKDIICVIADAAKFTMDDVLVDDLVTSMKDEEDRISPVDIGITLLALNERALAKATRHLDKGDYKVAGGATGLLAEYMSNQLDRFGVDERATILKAMLELADLGNDQRLTQGLLPEQLASKIGFIATVQRYVNYLELPQVRLLERLSLSGAYRLSHERLVPALRQLARTCACRSRSDRPDIQSSLCGLGYRTASRKLLFTGHRLSDVVKYRAQLYWGTDRDDKETFFRESLRRRVRRRALVGAISMAFLAIYHFGWSQINAWQNERG